MATSSFLYIAAITSLVAAQGAGEDPFSNWEPAPHNSLTKFLDYFPSLKPNYHVTDGRHDIDSGHLVDHDFRLEFEDIVKENGFGFENHYVVTDDGYILSVFHIINPHSEPNAPAVFMQHGIIDTADCFIMNHPDETSAFVFSRAGYDVWLGNSRGNRFSRKHTHLNPDSWNPQERKEFFDYSFQEQAEYDLIPMIDLVRAKTGQDKVTYVGHS